MNAGNARLGLTQTTPGTDGYWGTTTTSVTDPLRLLRDIVSWNSPLLPSSRGYILYLMSHVEASEQWGVSAAADPGTVPAIKIGFFQHSANLLWVVDSMGVIQVDGHLLLTVVRTDNQPDLTTGQNQIAQVSVAGFHAVTHAD